MVKAYNGALILADILLLILKILYYICESVYKFFIPTKEKSVAGEIVLVRIAFTHKYTLMMLLNTRLSRMLHMSRAFLYSCVSSCQ